MRSTSSHVHAGSESRTRYINAFTGALGTIEDSGRVYSSKDGPAFWGRHTFKDTWTRPFKSRWTPLSMPICMLQSIFQVVICRYLSCRLGCSLTPVKNSHMAPLPLYMLRMDSRDQSVIWEFPHKAWNCTIVHAQGLRRAIPMISTVFGRFRDHSFSGSLTPRDLGYCRRRSMSNMMMFWRAIQSVFPY